MGVRLLPAALWVIVLTYNTCIWLCQSFTIPQIVERSRYSASFRSKVVLLQSSSSPVSWDEDVPESSDELSDEDLEASMGEWDDRIARFNTVHLTGRVGNDPEPRYLDDGKCVVNLSLATRRKYHSMDRAQKDIKWGEEETDWYGLEIWGQTAEFVTKYVDKGARIGVIGSLQIDDWTDKATGEPRSRPKVIVRELDILETKYEAETRRSSRGGKASYGDVDSVDQDETWPSSAGSGDFF